MLSLKIAGISSQQIREMNSARSAVKVIRHFDEIGAYYGASPPSTRTYFSELGCNEGFGFKSPNQTEGKKGEIRPSQLQITDGSSRPFPLESELTLRRFGVGGGHDLCPAMK